MMRGTWQEASHQMNIDCAVVSPPVALKSVSGRWVCYDGTCFRCALSTLISSQQSRCASLCWLLPCVLEAHIQGAREKAEALTRDDQLDQADGSKQPASC